MEFNKIQFDAIKFKREWKYDLLLVLLGLLSGFVLYFFV